MRRAMIAGAEIADSRTNALGEARMELLYQSSLQTGRLDSTHTPKTEASTAPRPIGLLTWRHQLYSEMDKFYNFCYA